jgi:hypothetical protein
MTLITSRASTLTSFCPKVSWSSYKVENIFNWSLELGSWNDVIVTMHAG